MIRITPKAKENLLLERKKNQLSEEYYLRAAIEEGGCSGFRYAIKFDNEVKDSDKIFDQGDLKVLIDEESLPYLEDAQLDFSDGLEGKGFFFHNPVQKTCGCGKSFARA